MYKHYGYKAVFSEKALWSLYSLPKKKQRAIIDILRRLSEFPPRIGDSEYDDGGRKIQQLLFDEWLFLYWLDDAAGELRIVDFWRK